MRPLKFSVVLLLFLGIVFNRPVALNAQQICNPTGYVPVNTSLVWDWRVPETTNASLWEAWVANPASGSEVAQQGSVEVGQMNIRLLEKVEELTLYILELNRANEELRRRVEALEQLSGSR